MPSRKNSYTSIIIIHERVCFAFCSAEEAKILHRPRLRTMHFFTLEGMQTGAGCSFDPILLCDVYRFTKRMFSTLRRQNKDVVACASKSNGRLLTSTALLIGAYMILGKGVAFDDVQAAFSSLSR